VLKNHSSRLSKDVDERVPFGDGPVIVLLLVKQEWDQQRINIERFDLFDITRIV